jgi:hypothetical protein
MYISLIIIYILILKFSTNKNSIYSMGMKSVASVLDLSEGRYGLIGGIKNKLISAIEKLKKDFKTGFIDFIKNHFQVSFYFFMILYGLFIRYKPSFTNFYFFTPDTYVHQEWIKFLDINQLFVSSVYPRGYHAIVSSFYKLFL